MGRRVAPKITTTIARMMSSSVQPGIGARIGQPRVEVNGATRDIDRVNPAIFKAYDIRGLYPDEIDADAAGRIGRALAARCGAGPVVVGTDMRESGVALREAFVAGLRAEGVAVIDIGRVATPIVSFATAASGATAGAMITASHNPSAYNGIKLCGASAIPIGIESGLAEIRDRALELRGDSGAPAAALREEDFKPRYYDSLLELFGDCPRLSVVVDAGNGIAGEAYAGLLDRLPLDVTRLYFEPDGT